MAQRDRRRATWSRWRPWQELARILAHEIKNPLTPIEVAGDVVVAGVSEQERWRLSSSSSSQAQVMIGEELDHLKRTVSRFSEFARLPAPQLVEESPARLIQGFAYAAGRLASMAPIFRSMDDTAASDAARARVDSALLRQVLTNIIANGIEANRDRRVAFTIRVASMQGRVSIDISNDGAPVAPAIAPRLFDPYVSGSSGKDNMGLGLAIVKKIIVEHGGDIGYAEREGRPCFTITLPRVA